MTDAALVAVSGAIAATATAAGLWLRKRRTTRPPWDGSERRRARPDLEDRIDERVLHLLSNFAMGYRAVFMAVVQGDVVGAEHALDRVEEAIRERARYASERLGR